MMETMEPVSHQQASQLLHNKFIVVLGDSIQRSVYKDIVLLLQKEKYLTLRQLKSKGEMSFEQDCLVEGGCLSQMHNGTEYREVRQFQSAHHLVRFYFVTRIYSRYMQSILEDFHNGLKPDVIIVNSCIWDISRYFSTWIDDYKRNLHSFFCKLKGILPKQSLAIWNLTMPLGERIKGGFLVPEIEHKVPQMRHDVIEANFYSGTVADSYGMDVLDLHFQFRFSLQHRTKDGVHWNAFAHRRITSLLLQQSAQAWSVIMPCPLAAVECPNFPMGNYYRDEFNNDYLSFGCFEELNPQPWKCHHKAAGISRPALPPLPHLPLHKHRQVRNGVNDRPPCHFEPYKHQRCHAMRSCFNRCHYTPYTCHSQYGHHHY